MKDDKNKELIGSLSNEDKATFFRCLKCDNLRKIDYEKYKIYCSKSKCLKGCDENL